MSALCFFQILASFLAPAATLPAGITTGLDVSELSDRAAELHDSDIEVQGRVVWAGCQDGTCLLEVAGEDGAGAPVLVRSHTALPRPAEEVIGHVVTVTGRFYTKIYPRYRMAVWQGLGWHAEEDLPEMASQQRLDAVDIAIEAGTRLEVPHPAPLLPWEGPTFDLAAAEFEAGGMGTGRKCLAPGATTPVHSTGGHQELLFGLQGIVTVELHGEQPVELNAGQGLFIPPGTEHGLRNASSEPACYLFVYADSPDGDHE